MKMPRNIGPVHFVGIGGIGMSGIAEILHNQGYKVRGSDSAENPNVQRLRKMGIELLGKERPAKASGDPKDYVDMTLMAELEKSGFVQSVYK